jgi:two-component system, chemotaxis family, sensor kinase CheA
LNLPRLEALAHAAESLMGQFRDGAPVTPNAVSLILITLDRIKLIMVTLSQCATEPPGDDHDLIAPLEDMAVAAATAIPAAKIETVNAEIAMNLQVERAIGPGEATLDELERIFQETKGPEVIPQKTTQNDNAANTDIKGQCRHT